MRDNLRGLSLTKTGPEVSALFLLVPVRFALNLTGVVVFLVALLLAGCTPAPKSWKLSGPTMGTTYHITVVGIPAGESRKQLQQRVDKELAAVNQEMSTYIPDSELMQLNRGPINKSLPVSEYLAQVLGLSLDIYRRSGGAFEVTIGPLVNLWGFGPQPEPQQIPSDEAIHQLLQVLGSDALQLSTDPAQLLKTRAVEIDLSAIAKGHGVDRVAALLEQRGIENYLVEIGGELRTRGLNPKGQDWRIGIERPADTGHIVQKPIVISGQAVATSGDYRNYYERDGKRFAHTLDPRSGRPVEHRLASVTVIAATCAEADGWATALNVMGEDAALQLADREGLAVFLLVKTTSGFEERYSRAFAPYVTPEDSSDSSVSKRSEQ